MEQTFFEELSLADLEKIHSQMLSWIFNNDNLLSKDQKFDLLKELFQLETEFENIKCYTEYNSMDIVIKTDRYVIVIENKLKSSQHSNQLNKYIEKIDNDKKINENIERYFSFLTLVGEDSKNPGWINITYKQLLQGLNKIENFKEDTNVPSQMILKEYIKTLSNLVKTFEEFDQDHKGFPNVFDDANKTKYEKLNNLYHSNSQNYISKCNLESVFQTHFLRKIVKKLNINNYEYSIGDTHGMPLIQVNIEKLIINGFDFVVGFQYQNNTLKFNVTAIQYNHSNSTWIPQEVYDHIKNLVNDIEHFDRYNPPKYRAYFSISKTLNDKVYDINENDFISKLNEYIAICKVLASDLHNEVKKNSWDKMMSDVIY